MTDIVQMSKGGTKFYPQTHVQAVLGLPDYSTFAKSSDVATAISTAIKGIPPTDLSNYPTRSEMTTAITKATPDVSSFQKASDVQTAITNALGKIDTSQTMNDSTRNKLQTMNKEMGS